MNPTASTDGVVAFSGARVFDGKRTVADRAVLVENGVVLDVVPRDSVPEAVTHYREQDCTILPGLIDTHVHFMRWQGPQFLAFGVTTVRDTGNRLEWILDRRAEWQKKPWPRILCLGPLVGGPVPAHDVICRSCADLPEALTAVRETVKKMVDGLKFYVGLDPEWLPSMVDEGHAGGCKVSMHCAGSVLGVTRAGVDEFFHLDGILADVWPDRPPGWLDVWGVPEFGRTIDRQREVADHIARSGITATPTLAYWDSQWRIRMVDFPGTGVLLSIPSPMIEWQTVAPDPASAERWRRALLAAQGFVGLLVDRGVPILAGTDVPCGLVRPGRSLWREISLLAGAGMSPTQALRAATSDAAAFIGREDLGNLLPGSAADMVFVRGNPLDAIPAHPDIVLTVRNGVVHRPQELLAAEQESLADEPWARQFKRHWEKRNRQQAARKTPPGKPDE